MQFFTDYISDDYSVTVWIPQKKLALNNFYRPGTVNLYSLRGAAYRDPQVWRDGLKVLRDLQPEYLASTHTRAVKGQELVSETLRRFLSKNIPACSSFRPPSASCQQSHSLAMLLLSLLGGERKFFALWTIFFRQIA